MKRVLLTNRGSLFGKRMLQALVDAGVELDAVVVVRQPAGYRRALLRSVSRRVGIVQACWFAAQRLAEEAFEKDALKHRAYESFGPRVIDTLGTSSPQTQCTLSNLRPDLLLLGQTGIVRQNILDIPRLGTLNAHPGILPEYRGIDCCYWAILNGDFDKIGSTVHLVDRGVDTGPILVRKIWRPGEREASASRFAANEPLPLRDLPDALYRDCVELMVEVAGSLDEAKAAAAEPQSTSAGKQYYKMGLGDLAEVRRRWQMWCVRLAK